MTNDAATLQFDSILLEIKTNHVKEVYRNLAQQVNRLIGTPEDTILDQLMSEEKKMSSAIGQGVAIPHMRLPRLTRPMIVFGKLNQGVDFKSNDGEWVDMVCLVLSPEFEGPKHLQRLAMVTRYFKNKELCESLRCAQEIDDIKLIMRDMNAERLVA